MPNVLLYLSAHQRVFIFEIKGRKKKKRKRVKSLVFSLSLMMVKLKLGGHLYAQTNPHTEHTFNSEVKARQFWFTNLIKIKKILIWKWNLKNHRIDQIWENKTHSGKIIVGWFSGAWDGRRTTVWSLTTAMVRSIKP